MTAPGFSYQKILTGTESPEVTSLIAYQASATAPLEAILWHATREEWLYAPAIAASLLFDDSSETDSQPVDRPTAERLARQHLHTDLPTPEQLQAMISEGRQNPKI